MNAGKHTPGPWRVAGTNSGLFIAGATPGYLAEIRDCGSGDVAANALLVAAAPELLAALLACKNERPRLRRYYRGLDADRQWAITSAAIVALAKAGQS